MSTDQDTIGRSPLARNFADHVLALDASQGIVVGVLGPWGGGKTSFVNLALLRFRERGAAILGFNPWMFSGTEQLVESFFLELAAQLRLDPTHSEVGERLKEYGESFAGLGWLPVLGPWIQRASGGAKILGDLLKRRQEGISAKRERLATSLRALSNPIVVVLDDIDRLTTIEIQHVFKLVRLTASFPQIIYVVAFDRMRVEEALGDSGVPGRQYLEKILQVAVDLPALPSEVLNKQVFAALDRALAGVETGPPFNTAAWTDIYVEVVRPLIRNMRDVRRYAAAVRGTVLDLQGGMAPADILGLEAIRVFLPDVFSLLHQCVPGLTTIGSHGSRHENPALKAQVDSLVAAAGDRSDLAKAMIARLFPAAQRHIGNMNYGADWQMRWLRDRRVAHEDILLFYLERVAGESLIAFADAERAVRVMANASAFDVLLRQLPADRWQDIIGSLEAFEDDFKPEQVVPGTTTLLNLLPSLPERTRGMFELSSPLVVTRVVYRLLKSLGNEHAVEGAVREIVPQLRSISAQLELIEMVGYGENRGHKLVTESFATALEADWVRRVRTTPADQLAREHGVLGVLLALRRWLAPDDEPFEVPNGPELTLALLEGAKSDVVSQSVDSRAVRRTPRLQWKALETAFGSEAVLTESIERLASSGIASQADVLTLAQKYITGWRPDRDIDD
ncbi:MAG: P-loop NTPase fold protein [Gemmatimonadales bacterium]|nr:P-loop NTPase fold protein [Gemmatimonadales bacterium]